MFILAIFGGIALAIRNIGRYTGLYNAATARVHDLQMRIQQVAKQTNGKGLEGNRTLDGLQAQLALTTFLQGLFKDFLEYWKQVIKDILQIIKSISELASGSR